MEDKDTGIGESMDIGLEMQLNDSMTLTEQQSIERCVKQISTTKRGTAPFLRDMGLESAMPVGNSPADREEFLTDIVSQIDEWDERVEAKSAAYDGENKIKVVIESGEPE